MNKMTDQEFIGLWNASNSCEDVCAESGHKIGSVRCKAKRLREQGHYLKSMRSDLDIEDLTNVANFDFKPTQREFILIWQLSNSVKEVASIIDQNPASVRSKARMYRDIGIPLKKFSKGRPL